MSPRHYGWFRGDTPHVLGANVIWVLVVFGWTMGMMYPFFLLLRKFNLLRITREEELVRCAFTPSIITHSYDSVGKENTTRLGVIEARDELKLTITMPRSAALCTT